ncbi:unnamed protein product [Urochloa decumbens]|uniref:Uncharacterized protein n=1 Tax=Urochloa decumbens TaxID=240449 RepID=A0ABC9AXZ7_9POAL
MAEAILLAISKTEVCMADEAVKTAILKLPMKVRSLKVLPMKISGIRDQLDTMNNAIQEIGTASFNEAVVKGWIAEVRKVAFRVDDIMDKYMYNAHQLQEKKPLVLLFKGISYEKIFSDISDDISQIEEEIKQLIKLKEQWLRTSQLISHNYKLDSLERQSIHNSFPGLLTDGDLVGIEDNREKLTQWLHSKEPDSTILTVWGMGGLGKTTLVLNVYEREKSNFPAHGWVHVSQNYTVESVLRKLLSSIGYSKQAESDKIDKMSVYELKEELKTKLKGTKCLIVLDDVWDREFCTQVVYALHDLQESRTIITTRMNHVAALAPPNRRLQLQPLRPVEAFDLFCRRAFYNKNHKCPQELEELSNGIVDRCQGLPLAIVSIGSMLSSLPPTEYIWNQRYSQLRSELTNNDHVRAILNLSYHDLPGNLRNCFLYCSLFPEDYAMPREILVRLWVAEGFVVRKQHSTLEEEAEGYLMELIQRSMLEPVEYDELGRMDRDVRRLSLCKWRDESEPRLRFACVRTLVALELTPSSLRKMLCSVLSESVWLTVLQLQDSTISEVPSSIGNLFNLRYIGLRRTYVKSLPDSIEKLSNLQTLDIKQTKIEKLPQGICHAKKLRHLLADRFANEEMSEFRFFVGVEAPKGLANLEELQTLETVQSSKDLGEQLKKLMQLKSVWIDNISSAHCAELFSTLSDMPLLSSLLLSAIDQNEVLHFGTLMPKSKNLHRLIVRGRWADGILESPVFRYHGIHLKYLALDWCQLGEDPLGVLAHYMSNLTYLSFDMVNSANNLVLPAGCFPHLKMLKLERMPDVNQLDIMVGALPRIEAFYIVELENLERISQGIESLLSLKRLWLLDLRTDFTAIKEKMQHVPDIQISYAASSKLPVVSA